MQNRQKSNAKKTHKKQPTVYTMYLQILKVNAGTQINIEHCNYYIFTYIESNCKKQNSII